MKVKFDWSHVTLAVLAMSAAVLLAYVHSPFFGNAHPTPPTAMQWVAYATSAVVAFAGFWNRSPADLYKIIEGELLEVASANGGGSGSTPVAPTGPASPPGAPPPAAAARMGASSMLLMLTFVVVVVIVVAACTPTKVATAVTLGTTTACVFEKIDAGEAPEQAAADCGVGVNDVFQLISLFDRRAAARKLCGPALIFDGGTP